MPYYDFDCPDCGSFSAWRTIANRDVSAFCPECETECTRSVSAPNLSLMPSGNRQAHARNEKSQHQPGVSTRHKCSSRCGCGTGKPASRSTRTVDLGKAGRFETPRKAKRPWMLGH